MFINIRTGDIYSTLWLVDLNMESSNHATVCVTFSFGSLNPIATGFTKTIYIILLLSQEVKICKKIFEKIMKSINYTNLTTTFLLHIT